MSPRRKANSIANDTAATVTAIHQDAPAFPEEIPEEAHAIDPEGRYDENEETDPMAFERAGRPAPTTVTAQPTPKPRQPAPRLPPQRRVSAEVVKAETRLLSLERRRQESLAHHDAVWAEKRAGLILSFPDDVHAALVAMGVLVEVEPEPGE